MPYSASKVSVPLPDGLKAREWRVLEALAAWRGPDEPLADKLAAKLDFAGESSVRAILEPLENRGLIERRKVGTSKVPQLTNKGREALGLLPQPRVLDIRNTPLDEPLEVNPVPCGGFSATAPEPLAVAEMICDLLPNYQPGDQLLEAAGNSMESSEGGDSIYDGDRCLLRPGVWPQPGDVAYVEYELANGLRECTLKEWYPTSDGLVRLVPRNSHYPVIECPQNHVVVQGVVFGVIHAMRRRNSMAVNRT